MKTISNSSHNTFSSQPNSSAFWLNYTDKYDHGQGPFIPKDPQTASILRMKQKVQVGEVLCTIYSSSLSLQIGKKELPMNWCQIQAGTQFAFLLCPHPTLWPPAVLRVASQEHSLFPSFFLLWPSPWLWSSWKYGSVSCCVFLNYPWQLGKII